MEVEEYYVVKINDLYIKDVDGLNLYEQIPENSKIVLSLCNNLLDAMKFNGLEDRKPTRSYGGVIMSRFRGAKHYADMFHGATVKAFKVFTEEVDNSNETHINK